MRHCALGQKVACLFQCWKNSLLDLRFTGLLILVVLMRNWMGPLLRKNQLLRRGFLSLLNWIGALTLSPSLKQCPTKLEP